MKKIETEADWLACTDPAPMLEFLGAKATERKMRLFACGCCRSVWHLISQEVGRTAVDIAERFADNASRSGELAEAYANADALRIPAPHPVAVWLEALARALQAAVYAASSPAAYARYDDGITEQYDATYNTLMASGCVAIASALAGRAGEDLRANRLLQSSYIRCIFGNPFHPVAVNPDWLTPAVVELARTIYDERAFNRLPILADALEEAGCEDTDILNHCRSEGPHVRGCWVVDMLLGKE